MIEGDIDFTSTYLGITTGIKFKLYISDYYDNLIYKSLIEKYGDKNSYKVTVDELYGVFYDYPEIRDMLKKLEKDYDDDELIEVNTIVFIASILETYQNLRDIILEISNENFDRVTIHDGQETYNFYLDITSAVIDLYSFFDKNIIDIINKELIKMGVISNSYIQRSAYAKIKWENFCELLAIVGATIEVDMNDFIGPITSFFGNNANETEILLITDYIDY